jgi:AcrR family transcriptional regulator
MNEKFFDLTREKQDRIINGGLKVFSKTPYKYASTDRIVEEAKISKGLLFHYFGSKEGIYTFLYDYSMRYVELELYSTISIKETNYFELLREIEEANIKIRENYFFMLAFIAQAEMEEEEKIKKVIAKKSIRRKENYDKIIRKADMSFLNGFENKEQVENIIKYCMVGFDREYEKRIERKTEPWTSKKKDMINLLESLFIGKGQT